MKAGETTLNELIVRGDRQYRVPLYQRPYTWGEENWRQLWAGLCFSNVPVPPARASRECRPNATLGCE
jgi:hypothetical protein